MRLSAPTREVSRSHPREAGAPGSVGIRVELPFEQNVNPFVEQAFDHETFFKCLDTADEASAVVRDFHREWSTHR